jgi:hypothetical protein
MVLGGLVAAVMVSSTSSGRVDLVARHPDAVAQRTPTGRVLTTLVPHKGQIYAGFGDYSANTGPIAVRRFDPVGGWFGDVLFRSGTEAIYLYRVLNGRIYVPHIDPSVLFQNGGYAVGGDGEWRDVRPVCVAHVFDVATLTGQDLWMCGSDGPDAVVWHSPDGGPTWAESLRDRPTYEHIGRFYGLGILGGRIYVQKSEPGVKLSKVFDGRRWSDGPNLLPPGGMMWHPETFANQIVYQTNHAAIRSSPLYRFDGVRAQVALSPPARGQSGPGAEQGIYGFTVADDRVMYALGIDRTVYVTNDLLQWHALRVDVPAEARSLCVLDKHVYFGGSNGELFRSRGEISPDL